MKKSAYQQWVESRKRGPVVFILRYMLITGIGITVGAALVKVGYPALKKGSWPVFEEGLLRFNWSSRLLEYALIGLGLGLYNWYFFRFPAPKTTTDE